MGTQQVKQQKVTVYKPRIKGKEVIYRNTQGQNVKTEFEDKEQLCLPQALSKAVTAKTPNVTKLDLEEALWECSEQLIKYLYKGYVNSPLLERAEKLIDHYSEKISEDEPKGVITQNEQFKMMEFWHKWFGSD